MSVPGKHISEEQREALRGLILGGMNATHAAREVGVGPRSARAVEKTLAREGRLGTKPVLPGFHMSQVTTTKDGEGRTLRESVQQKPARGEAPPLPDGLVLDKLSRYTGADGELIGQWEKFSRDQQLAAEALRAALEGFKDELPRADPVPAPAVVLDDILCQYTITDHHLGALAWGEETGGGDYDISIAEKLLDNWSAAAIAGAPAAKTAVLAQLGDFMHYDGFKSVTPEHGNQLDGDTRYPKMVRAAIRVLRRFIDRLLVKHDRVHIIMSDANHDPAAGVWLREMFAVLYENEPRVTVDTSPGTYTVFEFGDTSLFYHHFHRRKITNVDTVFVGRFREIYGRTKHSYGHGGHLHSDELISTNLMKVERHETLAAPDAYAANGGWLSGRSAKVIHYHRRHGEVGRNTITAAMVMP